MINVPQFSQRDPKWGNERLGNSTRLIKDDGCLLTCITMMLNSVGYSETPKTVNSNLIKVGAFSGALIVWGNVQKAYHKVKFVYRDWNYNNFKVWWQINIKHMPVPVQVNAAKIGGFRHWVLFIGNQKMVDPWSGMVLPTSYYTPLTGDGIYDHA